MTVQNHSHYNISMSYSEIICLVLVFCFFTIGLYLHTKIVMVSKREKDMTWTLDATNSCCILIHFVHYMLMSIVTILVEDLYMYTGRWFCYVSNFLSYYGMHYYQTHSLVIAMLKYVHIVWWMKVTVFGKETINALFFWINLLNPLLMILIHLAITPDFFIVWTGYPHVARCLGDEKGRISGNSTHPRPKLHDLCIDIETPSGENVLEYTLFVFEKSTCWIQWIMHVVIFWNILEVLVYYLIFRFMHR